MEKLPDLVVPFKRKIYERVVKEFSKFASPLKKLMLQHVRHYGRAISAFTRVFDALWREPESILRSNGQDSGFAR